MGRKISFFLEKMEQIAIGEENEEKKEDFFSIGVGSLMKECVSGFGVIW